MHKGNEMLVIRAYVTKEKILIWYEKKRTVHPQQNLQLNKCTHTKALKLRMFLAV